jgi:tocopherol cyclase
VRLDGRLVRLGEPLVAPVRATIAPGSWRLAGRSARFRVEVEAAADPAAAQAMDVPVPGEHRSVPTSHQHLTGRLRVRVSRRGRTLYAGETELAGLEQGRGAAP